MLSRYGIIILSLLIVLGVYGSAFADWTPEVRISEPGGCWYPQMIAQGDTIHVVYTNWAGGDKVSYVRSTNAGNDWSEHQILSDTTNTDVTSYPRIITFSNNILILWKNIFSEGIICTNIGYSLSHDGGLTWDEPDYVFNPNIEHIYHLVAAASGQTINIIYSDYSVEDPIFNHVRSSNFGQSWSDAETLFIAGETGMIDMAAYNNTFHCVWYGNFEEGDYWETYYIRSTNGGISWSDNVMLTTDDNHNSYWPSLSTNEYGNVAFCWTDFKYSPGPFSGDIFVRYSQDDGYSWTDEEQITFDHLAKYSHIFWRSDTVHAVWESGYYTQRSIYYSMDGGSGWSEEYRLDDDPDDSYCPRVTASNRKIYVIWADDRHDPDNDIYRGIYFTRYEEDVNIDENYLGPVDIDILTAYPNPFNSSTVISYSNLKGGDIEIYEITGRLVKQLKDGGRKEGKVTWDATDAFGEKVSSGI